MANSVIVSGIKIQKAPLLYFIHMNSELNIPHNAVFVSRPLRRSPDFTAIQHMVLRGSAWCQAREEKSMIATLAAKLGFVPKAEVIDKLRFARSVGK
jgi:hypothetical protein